MAKQENVKRLLSLSVSDVPTQEPQARFQKTHKGKMHATVSQDKRGRFVRNGDALKAKLSGVEKKRNSRPKLSDAVTGAEGRVKRSKSIVLQNSQIHGLSCGEHEQVLVKPEETALPSLACEGNFLKTQPELGRSSVISTVKGAFVRRLPQQLPRPEILLHERKKPAIPIKVRLLQPHPKPRVAQRTISPPPRVDSAVSFSVYQVQKPKDHEYRRIVAVDKLDNSGLEHDSRCEPIKESEFVPSSSQVHGAGDKGGLSLLVAGPRSAKTADTSHDQGITHRSAPRSDDQTSFRCEKFETYESASPPYSSAQQDLEKPWDVDLRQGKRDDILLPLQCESVVRETPCNIPDSKGIKVVGSRSSNGAELLKLKDYIDFQLPWDDRSVAVPRLTERQSGKLEPDHEQELSGVNTLHKKSENRCDWACSSSSCCLSGSTSDASSNPLYRIDNEEDEAFCFCFGRTLFNFQGRECGRADQAVPKQMGCAAIRTNDDLVSTQQPINLPEHEQQLKEITAAVYIPKEETCVKKGRTGQHEERNSLDSIKAQEGQLCATKVSDSSTLVPRFASCRSFCCAEDARTSSTGRPNEERGSSRVQSITKPPQLCSPLPHRTLEHVPVKVRVLKRIFQSQEERRSSPRFAEYEEVTQPSMDEPIRFSLVQVQSKKDNEKRRLVAFRVPVHPEQITEMLRQRQLIRRYDYVSGPQSCEDAFGHLCVPRELSECNSLHSEVTIGFQYRTTQIGGKQNVEIPPLPPAPSPLVLCQPPWGVSVKALQVAEKACTRVATRIAQIQDCKQVNLDKERLGNNTGNTSPSHLTSGDHDGRRPKAVDNEEFYAVNGEKAKGYFFNGEDLCGIGAYVKCFYGAPARAPEDDYVQQQSESIIEAQSHSSKPFEGLTSQITSRQVGIVDVNELDVLKKTDTQSGQRSQEMCSGKEKSQNTENCIPVGLRCCVCPWSNSEMEGQEESQLPMGSCLFPVGSAKKSPLVPSNSHTQSGKRDLISHQEEFTNTSTPMAYHAHIVSDEIDQCGTPVDVTPILFESLPPEGQESVRKIMLQKSGIVCVGGTFVYTESCGETLDLSAKGCQKNTYFDDSSVLCPPLHFNRQCGALFDGSC